MLRIQGITQQWVVEQVDLCDGQVVGGMPVAVHLLQLRGRQRSVDGFLLTVSSGCAVFCGSSTSLPYGAGDACVEVIGGRHREVFLPHAAFIWVLVVDWEYVQIVERIPPGRPPWAANGLAHGVFKRTWLGGL